MEPLIAAALKMIKPQMTVSFGGGRTVGRLIRAIKEPTIKIASPSEQTRQLCLELGIPVVSLPQVKKFDLAFDGCDSLDENLNALKSNGGIHTFEKLYAQLADRYIIMAPIERFKEELNPDVQLTLEVLDLAIPQVITEVEKLGGSAKIRQASEMAGMFRTPNGNGLVDIHFENWTNISEINRQLAQTTGVMGTSYFENIVTDALLATDKDVKHIKKEDL
ncbi:ribose 5-phosphate isomerase [Companilactobacillus mindensis DSM 14500]|uniref:ribose-5-phosphate isomerase n=1 Tax=Companilactobacillus mindensis DSM 14500 TaxID=1423770 RepID=A0A0R1QN34_9LACO|nr:ribose-5-phosphate isomerase A [Companilactobacillus mindensis]KRL43605.1 ribose 5-phosphate isomerase [Companilactobacillus mindensis DSM 14500]GEO78646.1 ribose-5-phosphate isomerase [Companilactobacillus mindensis]